MVCVHTRDGHPAALDPADGTVRWTADWLDADGHHVALRPSLVPGGDVTWLGWIETDPPAVRVRHHFDGQVICLTRSGYVVCQSATLVDGPSRVQVWRLRD
jgi:hypothetical protein